MLVLNWGAMLVGAAGSQSLFFMTQPGKGVQHRHPSLSTPADLKRQNHTHTHIHLERVDYLSPQGEVLYTLQADSKISFNQLLKSTVFRMCCNRAIDHLFH